MKKMMGLALVSGGLMFAVACTPAVNDTIDASSSRADAGTVADSGHNTGNDAAVAQDSGGNTGTWVASNYGVQCQSDTDCPGGSCIDLFNGQQGSVGSCFKLCADAATDCADFRYSPSTVSCASVGGSPNVCIMGSGQNGPCGNVLNATCTDENYGMCGTDSSGAGSCVRGCNMDDPENGACVAVSAANCGCLNGDHCSNMLAFGTAESYDGVCAPATTVGATCGFDEGLNMIPCTDGQTCEGLSQSNPMGTCAEPSVDGGMVEDAG